MQFRLTRQSVHYGLGLLAGLLTTIQIGTAAIAPDSESENFLLFDPSVVSGDTSPLDHSSDLEVDPSTVFDSQFAPKTGGDPLDQLVRQYLSPGNASIAVAVIDGAKPIRSWGSRDVFHIGSMTKGFTGFLALLLEQQHKISLDRPIADQLKAFGISEFNLCPGKTAVVDGKSVKVQDVASLRDLLSHRSGLASDDSTVLPQYADTADLLARLGSRPCRAGAFRNRYAYSNAGVSIAGHLLGLSARTGWANLIQDQVLRRLGMNNTTVRADYASIQPAGTIDSTIGDMGIWLRFLMSGGQKPLSLIRPGEFYKLTEPNTLIRGEPGSARQLHYALGWRVETFADGGQYRTIVHHTGHLYKHSAFIGWVPDRQAGVVVLIDQQAGHYFKLPQRLATSIFAQLGAVPQSVISAPPGGKRKAARGGQGRRHSRHKRR